VIEEQETINKYRLALLRELRNWNVDPEVAVQVLIGVAAQVTASQNVGRFRWVWYCWKHFWREKKRLFALRVASKCLPARRR